MTQEQAQEIIEMINKTLIAEAFAKLDSYDIKDIRITTLKNEFISGRHNFVGDFHQRFIVCVQLFSDELNRKDKNYELKSEITVETIYTNDNTEKSEIKELNLEFRANDWFVSFFLLLTILFIFMLRYGGIRDIFPVNIIFISLIAIYGFLTYLFSRPFITLTNSGILHGSFIGVLAWENIKKVYIDSFEQLNLEFYNSFDIKKQQNFLQRLSVKKNKKTGISYLPLLTPILQKKHTELLPIIIKIYSCNPEDRQLCINQFIEKQKNI